MPLQWNIFPVKRLVNLQSDGALRFSDLEAYLQALASESAFPYRKLFDARLGSTEMNESDVLSYAGMVSGYATLWQFGPCAVVAGGASVVAHRPLITQLLLTNRPLRVFSKVADAEQWLWLHKAGARSTAGAGRSR